MKKLNITTSQGCFIIVDKDSLDMVSGQALVDMYGDYIPLDEITEEQASEIVDKMINMYQDYLDSKVVPTFQLPSALDSLHSLIKSKGWYLKNPYAESLQDACSKAPHDTYESKLEECDLFRQAESRTFHNPVIFKIN